MQEKSRTEVFEKGRAAQRKWVRHSFAERLAILEKAALLFRSEQDRLARIISCETGKPLWETRGEVGSCAAKIAISAIAHEERTGEKTLKAPANMHKAALWHRPLGLFTILGPFNFPMHLPNGHIVPSLLAGNAVLFKPSEKTPESGAALVDIYHQAGVPEGVLQCVQGGVDVAQFLSDPALIDGVLFTGSYAVGKLLHQRFAGYPEKMLALEMGGNNPLVWWDTEAVAAAARVVVQSAFLSAGQRCSCARRLILPEDKRGEVYIEALKKAMQRLRIGKPFDDPPPFAGPLIDVNAADALVDAARRLAEAGARIHRPLIRLEALGPAYLQPGLYELSPGMADSDHEVFGPLLKVYRAHDFRAAIEMANASAFGLAGALLDDNATNWDIFRHSVRAGILNWNRPTNGASSAAPFGGPGHSGNLRPSAYYAADYCAYPVASVQATDCRDFPLLPGMEE